MSWISSEDASAPGGNYDNGVYRECLEDAKIAYAVIPIVAPIAAWLFDEFTIKSILFGAVSVFLVFFVGHFISSLFLWIPASVKLKNQVLSIHYNFISWNLRTRKWPMSSLNSIQFIGFHPPGVRHIGDKPPTGAMLKLSFGINQNVEIKVSFNIIDALNKLIAIKDLPSSIFNEETNGS